MAKLPTLKKRAHKNFKNKDYGHYRNNLYKIGETYSKKGDQDKWLMYMLECCYLDINGPNNAGGVSESYKDFLKSMKMWKELKTLYFNPDNHGVFAPAIIDELRSKIKDDSYQISNYKEIFIEEAREMNEDFKTPIDPWEAWKKLKNEF